MTPFMLLASWFAAAILFCFIVEVLPRKAVIRNACLFSSIVAPQHILR